jgi:NAD(P)-dependent dehydrogenase (short-subunit alcohol dehydrogenase family)
VANETALVTGGTAGIGYELSRALARHGWTLIITGRDLQRGETAAVALCREAGHERIEFIATDHSNVGGNQRLATRLGQRLERLDVLVNNVGRVFSRRDVTEDGYEASLALNFLAPFTLTNELRPLLAASSPARVINMNSSAHKMWKGDPLRDLQSQEHYVGISAHARAKLLNLIWTVALARQLDSTGVTVNALNPGAAWTPGTAQLTPAAVPFWRPIWPIVRFFQRRASAEKAAQTPFWLATDAAVANLSGRYFENKREQTLPETARDPDQQQRVIEAAAALVASAPTATATPGAGTGRPGCRDGTGGSADVIGMERYVDVHATHPHSGKGGPECPLGRRDREQSQVSCHLLPPGGVLSRLRCPPLGRDALLATLAAAGCGGSRVANPSTDASSSASTASSPSRSGNLPRCNVDTQRATRERGRLYADLARIRRACTHAETSTATDRCPRRFRQPS